MLRTKLVTLALVLATISLPIVAAPALAAAEQPDRTARGAAVVDINAAGIAELQTLPGIGPALARRIVAFRDEHGSFKTVEELLAVKGIGPKLLEKLRPRIKAGRAEARR